jgi:hypothetical protein
MSARPTGSAWTALPEKEKAHMRDRDRLAAERRGLPRLRIEKSYTILATPPPRIRGFLDEMTLSDRPEIPPGRKNDNVLSGAWVTSDSSDPCARIVVASSYHAFLGPAIGDGARSMSTRDAEMRNYRAALEETGLQRPRSGQSRTPKAPGSTVRLAPSEKCTVRLPPRALYDT